MPTRLLRKSLVAERWVLNASPLIVLARIGQEHLFRALADEIAIPRAVAEEIEAGPAGEPARQAVAGGQFPVVDTALSPEILAWDLGTGETAVLSFALAEPGWTVILDDAAARNCARSFGLSLKGTLAIVILAKQRGLTPSAADVLRSLLTIGFRLDEQIIRETLSRTVGETWNDV
jgi:predicted nucleic acid-binding protein